MLAEMIRSFCVCIHDNALVYDHHVAKICYGIYCLYIHKKDKGILVKVFLIFK